jgi:hypothetical protein
MFIKGTFSGSLEWPLYTGLTVKGNKKGNIKQLRAILWAPNVFIIVQYIS